MEVVLEATRLAPREGPERLRPRDVLQKLGHTVVQRLTVGAAPAVRLSPVPPPSEWVFHGVSEWHVLVGNRSLPVIHSLDEHFYPGRGRRGEQSRVGASPYEAAFVGCWFLFF